MITSDGDVKLIDFGLAIASEIPLTRPCGTKRYCSPEMKQEKYGQKADIWALGATFYNMVTGDHAFPEEEEKEDYKEPTGVSDECKDLISKMLEVDPEKRFSCQ